MLSSMGDFVMAGKTAITEPVTEAGEAASDAKRMVSAAVPNDLHEAIESHRWANRMSKAKVVEEALREWAEKRGLLQ